MCRTTRRSRSCIPRRILQSSRGEGARSCGEREALLHRVRTRGDHGSVRRVRRGIGHAGAVTDAVGLEGALLDLDVLRIAHGGVSVAEHDGRVVFVADTLPGERVRARVTEDRHDRWLRAETLAVLDPSPDRRPHIWAAASTDAIFGKSGRWNHPPVPSEPPMASMATAGLRPLPAWAAGETTTAMDPSMGTSQSSSPNGLETGRAPR